MNMKLMSRTVRKVVEVAKCFSQLYLGNEGRRQIKVDFELLALYNIRMLGE